MSSVRLLLQALTPILVAGWVLIGGLSITKSVEAEETPIYRWDNGALIGTFDLEDRAGTGCRLHVAT